MVDRQTSDMLQMLETKNSPRTRNGSSGLIKQLVWAVKASCTKKTNYPNQGDYRIIDSELETEVSTSSRGRYKVRIPCRDTQDKLEQSITLK